MAEETIDGESKPAVDPAGEEQFAALLKQELQGKDAPETTPIAKQPAQQTTPKGPVQSQSTVISEPAEKKIESTVAEPDQIKKLEAEIARLTKMVEDNKAGFTKKSMQLAEVEKAKAALEEELDAIKNAPVLEDVDDATLAEYPDAIKKTVAKGNALAKELSELKRKEAERERERQAAVTAQELAKQAQENFKTNILPKILEVAPEYKNFMLPRAPQYEEFLAQQTPGDRFAFSPKGDSDPRDLIRGYRAFRTYLGMPEDGAAEAVQLAESAKNKQQGAFTSHAQPASYTPPAPPAQTEPLTEKQLFQKEMEKLQASLQRK